MDEAVLPLPGMNGGSWVYASWAPTCRTLLVPWRSEAPQGHEWLADFSRTVAMRRSRRHRRAGQPPHLAAAT